MIIKDRVVFEEQGSQIQCQGDVKVRVTLRIRVMKRVHMSFRTRVRIRLMKARFCALMWDGSRFQTW